MCYCRCGRDGRNGKAILYATAWSVADHRVSCDMKEAVSMAKSGQCLKRAVLSLLATANMDSNEPFKLIVTLVLMVHHPSIRKV